MSDEWQAWKGVSTCTVSDALDRLRIAGQCLGIRLVHGSAAIVGRAMTVRMVPIGQARGTVGDYIDDVPEGYVVVIDNGGRLDATVWGDILTAVAHRRGVAGTVIHGVCRDLSTSKELNYPIFSRGNYMRTGKDRVQAEDFNVPISLGEIRVEPGDLIVGDDDGVVVVPKQREREVLENALQVHAAENRIRDAVAKGARLDRARREFGYFDLQGASEEGA